MGWKRVISTVGIVCSLLLAINSDAAVKWAKYSYFKNLGGLNDNLSTTEIEDNEATDIQNVIFDTGGAIRKRFGYTTIPNIPSKVATGTTVCVNGIFFYKLDSGSRYLVALANNDGKATLMKKDYQSGGGPATGNWENIDNASLSASYTNNYQPDFAVAQNVLVITDGTGTCNLFKWTGSGKTIALTTAAKAATGSILEYHKNHLTVSGDSDYPSRVYFSNIDDIYTWTSTDFFDVETSDGSKVRALVSAMNSLYIFKDKSIWRLSGTNRDDYVLEKMVDGIGTLSNSSIAIVNNLIYFTTQQNDIAVYDGGYTVKFISQKIRGTIGNLDFSRATNTSGLAFSSYKYVDYDYFVSVTYSGSATNNRILMFDTAYGAWTKFLGMNVNCMCVGDDDSGKNSIYFGDYSGYIHRYPSTGYYDGNVATSAIVAYYQTKWFKYSDICLGDKYWRKLKTYTLSSDNTYLLAECRSDYEASGKTLSINLSSSQSKWDVFKWDIDLWGGDTIIIGDNEVEKGKNMFQIKYSNEVVNQGFTIIGFENFIEPTERI